MNNYINEHAALVWAVTYADIEEFDYCLNRGDDINVQDENGRTALRAAVEEGYNYYAKVLIEKGADVNKQDKDGDTPLDYAIYYENREIADLLRKHGAKKREGKSYLESSWDSVYSDFRKISDFRK